MGLTPANRWRVTWTVMHKLVHIQSPKDARVRRRGCRRTRFSWTGDWDYLAAPAYFAGLFFAFCAQSSQQTVISWPLTLTLIPPSLISQWHTGHFFAFMTLPPFLETQTNTSVAASFAGDSLRSIVARRGRSDYQILAHFTKRSAARVAAHLGGCATKLTVEGVGEVAVTGKTEVEGERGEILRAVGQSFERSAEAQPGQVAMDRQAGSLLKDAGEMKGRRVDGT